MNDKIQNPAAARGRLSVLARPSAMGKRPCSPDVRKRYPDVWLSTSVTTRNQRPGEIDGVHYHFISEAEFADLEQSGELLEWAVVHGQNKYGTPRQPVLDVLAQGRPALLEIDLQGARQVRETMPDARFVFLAPPSWEELTRRLTGRGTESAEEQERRLATARVELAAASDCDNTIINDEVERATDELIAAMS